MLVNWEPSVVSYHSFSHFLIGESVLRFAAVFCGVCLLVDPIVEAGAIPG
jgi:hypothetical protein